MAFPARPDYDAAADRILELMRLRVTGRFLVDPSCFDAVRLEEDRSYLADQLVARFEAHIYGQRLANHVETREFDTPATWWDHWKHDHEPTWWAGWWVRRRPPAYKTTTLTTTWENYSAYPTYKGVEMAPVDPFGHGIHYVLPPKHSVMDYWPPSRENDR